MLLLPVVRLVPAESPKAMLLLPVVLLSALNPKHVLLLPFVLKKKGAITHRSIVVAEAVEAHGRGPDYLIVVAWSVKSMQP